MLNLMFIRHAEKELNKAGIFARRIEITIKEFLKSKSVYLYQIVYKQYVNYVPKNMQSRIENDNDFRNFEKSRIGEGKRAKKIKKETYNIAQNQSVRTFKL